MKDVLVFWNKDVFDGEKKLLPNTSRLYTQIYDIPENGNSWSLVFNFEETPRVQGYKSKAKVGFLVDEAPLDVLKTGLKFDFLDGSHKLGVCEIINVNSINISEVQTRIDLIENEKIDFKNYVNSIKSKDVVYTDDDLNKIVMYSNDYPNLFSLVLKLDKDIALNYLKNYFLTEPIESNFVYHSNLPLFLFNLKKCIGEKMLKSYIDSFSEEVKNNEIVVNALDEIL